jgi:hypothetical protein
LLSCNKKPTEVSSEKVNKIKIIKIEKQSNDVKPFIMKKFLKNLVIARYDML